MNMKYTIAAMAATTAAANAATMTLGSTDVGDYTASARNFENVDVNTIAADSGNNLWNVTWDAGSTAASNIGFTIGALYLLDGGFDLSTTEGGIEDLTFSINSTDATGFSNWRPIIAIDGAIFTLVGTNIGNPNNMKGTDVNDFGGSLGLSTQWGNLKATALNIDAIDGSTNPDFSATSGTLQVGFMQWAASSSGHIETASFTTGLEAFTVAVDYTAVPEPSSAALLGLGGLALILRRRK